MNEDDLLLLQARIGDEHLGQRLRTQVDRTLRILGQGRARFHFEHIPLFIQAIDLALRVSFLYPVGRRNALAFAVREHGVPMQDLPPAFDNLRILQLTDLHLDGYQGLGQKLAEAIDGLHFDACVLTGDFRFHDTGQYEHLAAELDALLPALDCRFGVYGILGNHDFIEMVPMLEARGVHMLLNEAVPLTIDGTSLWVVGLDDAHLYGLHDLDRGLADVPPDAPRVLLVHSPEIIPEAADQGFGLYLCGHTHGGQFCLPGGRAPYVNARCPREYTAGAWQYNGMVGYTSWGAGSSGVFARFFCPPEIVIHRLQAAD